MKKNIVIVGENMFVPTCIFALFYCLFYQYVANFPCVFFIRLIIFLLSVFILLTWIISLFKKTSPKSKLRISHNPIIQAFYLGSRNIVTLIFCFYFAIYLMLSLYKISVFYNYLVLLLFGLYLGYEIAVKANLYKKK